MNSMAKKVIEAVKKVVAPKKVVEPKVVEDVVVDEFAKRHPGANPAFIYE
jgi:hypothetical protein